MKAYRGTEKHSNTPGCNRIQNNILFSLSIYSGWRSAERFGFTLPYQQQQFSSISILTASIARCGALNCARCRSFMGKFIEWRNAFFFLFFFALRLVLSPSFFQSSAPKTMRRGRVRCRMDYRRRKHHFTVAKHNLWEQFSIAFALYRRWTSPATVLFSRRCRGGAHGPKRWKLFNGNDLIAFLVQ